MYDPKQIIDLAKEIEKGDPIDWADLPLDRDAVYGMLGLSVLERAYDTDSPTEREVILLATAVNLVVANFVLEMRLKNKDNNDGS